MRCSLLNNILLLWIAHIIGDFYIQNEMLARNKHRWNSEMKKHLVIYALPFLCISIFFNINIYILMIIIISHACIDICTVECKRKYKDRELIIFCIDQLLHFVVIYTCSYQINTLVVVPDNYLLVVFSVLMLMKPIGIIISLIFKIIFRNEVDGDNIKIGRYIGYLERIIIFLLCCFDSISTIGFVLAAKTMVRYKDINTNENHFQEKYLIGTLMSSIGALCCYAVVRFF